MKKITMLVSFLALGGSIVFAQGVKLTKVGSAAEQTTLRVSEGGTSSKKNSLIKKVNKTTATPFYTQDFSGGIPGDWTNVGSSGGSRWEYRGPSTTPSNATGSRGAYATGTGPILSATAANGFVIFDSDYLDNGGTPTGTGTAPSPHFGNLTSGSIDCSAQPTVLLEFTQYMRMYSTYTIVQVSKDAGTNWTDYPVNETLLYNKATEKDDRVAVNITPTAGGQADVMIRFKFDGTTQIPPTTSGAGYYFWQIDDITLSAMPANDLKLVADSVIFKNRIGYYTKVPKNHAPDTIIFAATYNNFGVNAQTNVTLHAVVTENGTEVFNSATAGVNVPSGSENNVRTAGFIRPQKVAAYNYTVTLKQNETDESPANNTFSNSFEVTENVFARDRNTYTNSVTSDSYFSVKAYASEQAGFKITNIIESYNDDTITSIEGYIVGNKLNGNKFKFQLLEDTNTVGNVRDMIVLAETEDYTFTNDTAKLIKLKLTTPYQVEPWKNYDIAFYSYLQDTLIDQYIGIGTDNTSPQPQEATRIYMPGNSTWYVFTNNALILRAYFNEKGIINIASSNVNVNKGLEMYPNPSTGSLRIALAETENITSIRVTNTLGAVVYEENPSEEVSTKRISLPGVKNGIYFVQVKAGEKVYQNKLLIQN